MSYLTEHLFSPLAIPFVCVCWLLLCSVILLRRIIAKERQPKNVNNSDHILTEFFFLYSLFYYIFLNFTKDTTWELYKKGLWGQLIQIIRNITYYLFFNQMSTVGMALNFTSNFQNPQNNNNKNRLIWLFSVEMTWLIYGDVFVYVFN